MSSEAEHEMKTEDPIAYAAFEMAQVYDNNRNEKGSLTDEGFIHLNHLFGLVPMELRGPTFLAFLSELDERGLEYDMSEFTTESALN
jgi:hypothetical protein